MEGRKDHIRHLNGQEDLGMGNFINTRVIASHQCFLKMPFIVNKIHSAVSIIVSFCS